MQSSRQDATRREGKIEGYARDDGVGDMILYFFGCRGRRRVCYFLASCWSACLWSFSSGDNELLDVEGFMIPNQLSEAWPRSGEGGGKWPTIGDEMGETSRAVWGREGERGEAPSVRRVIRVGRTGLATSAERERGRGKSQSWDWSFGWKPRGSLRKD